MRRGGVTWAHPYPWHIALTALFLIYAFAEGEVAMGAYLLVAALFHIQVMYPITSNIMGCAAPLAQMAAPRRNLRKTAGTHRAPLAPKCSWPRRCIQTTTSIPPAAMWN